MDLSAKGGSISAPWRAWFTALYPYAATIGASGSTAQRPTSGNFIGRQFFDTTLGTVVAVGSLNPTVWTPLGGSGSVTVAGSVSGAGTVASPVQLVNDAAAPGNSFYYGTNISGVKGFYTLPAGGSVANPTALIGLTAINGVATTAIRSDGAPAIDQSIAPSWTGSHAWDLGAVSALVPINIRARAAAGNQAISINDGSVFSNIGGTGGDFRITAGNSLSLFVAASTTTPALTIAGNGGVTINTPTGSARALTLNAINNQFGEQINGSAISGQSLGLKIIAGTTNADWPLYIIDQTQTNVYMQVFGDGSGTLGPTATKGLSWATGGNVIIAAPSSGITLTVAQTSGAGKQAGSFGTGLATCYSVFSGSLCVGTEGGDYPSVGYNWNPQSLGVDNYLVNDLSSRLQFKTGGFLFQTAGSGTTGNPITWASRLTISANGAVVIPAPASSTQAFSVTAATGASAATFIGNGGAQAAIVLSGSTAQQLVITGAAAGTGAISISTCATTGAKTASMTATNKPGTNNQTTPATWLPIVLDATTYYIPAYAA